MGSLPLGEATDTGYALHRFVGPRSIAPSPSSEAPGPSEANDCRRYGALQAEGESRTLILDVRNGEQSERIVRDALRAVLAWDDAAAIMLIPLAEHPRESERREGSARRLLIDRDAHRVWVDGRPVHLTAKEFALLCLLTDRRGAVLTRQNLLEIVWGSRYLGGPRTVDVHVRRLRRKLGDAFSLDTVRGVGYRYARERGGPLLSIAPVLAATQPV